MRRIALAAVVALLAASGPMAAQEATIRLSSVDGDVGISSGGEFVDARDGQTVFPGQQLLIGPDSSATVTYPDDCKLHYLLPGQFPILSDCDLQRSRDQAQERAQGMAPDALMSAAVVGGAVVGVALLIEESLDDDSEAPPLSP